ncbi:MAG TPA: acetoin utilization protein AcuC [Actinomycetota bacterium]|nr:acetoin utilization protein AcuC [Actinomycetota bacterium]
MSEGVELVRYGSGAPLYDHGPEHPLRPARVFLTYLLIDDYRIVDGDTVRSVDARSATDDELMLVHSDRYVDAVKGAGSGAPGPWERFGFGPGDNPVFPRMHEASARVAGASITGAEAVLSGRAEHAFNPSGGLHHAMPERASGFCVYDDPAIAIAWMLEHGASRIAYVDVDVHHGDGPQAIFYDDPRVLTISIHQDGRTLFPGTGFIEEHGAGDAAGTKVNIPVPPSTGDDAWVAALEQIAPPLVTSWNPDVLVTQLGCDTHTTDPLAWLDLTTNAYRRAASLLHSLAHEAAGGRWLATGGGGYQWARVVPRAWTIYFAEMAESAIPDEVPPAWLEAVRQEHRMSVPEFLSDAPLPAHDRDGAVADVVTRVKRAIFPAHGLPV